jgi:response regulator of citrate/malate metabolism
MSSPRPQGPQTEPAKAGSPLLWILEDDCRQCAIFEILLEGRYDARFIPSLIELDRLLKDACRPALLLADIQLPDGCFLDYLRHAEKGNPSLPKTMVLSSNSDIDTIRGCFRCGVSDYLIKPYHESELTRTGQRDDGRAAQIVFQGGLESSGNIPQFLAP